MALTAGTRLGSYEIRAPLGRGGMGEVYRAWDPRLEREVAVKILRERTETDPDRVRRFVAEARAASALNHPNILTVFDAAVDGATPYIVSELIEGESLRDEVRRGPLSLKRLLDLATQIADGLAEAHTAGIVHRDLKPENIMVTAAGRAKILDFGLARVTGPWTAVGIPTNLDTQTQTESGLLVGTVPYMSPEQARGTASDARSDQFSLGLILYEMATGTPAFRRETPAQTLEAILNEEPTPLPEVNARMPLLLWWVVERCLAKNPRDRYASTVDLHRDMRNLRDRLADAVAHERRDFLAQTTAPSRARRVVSAAAVVGAFAAGAGLWAVLIDPSPVEPSALRFTPFATEGGYEGLPAWSPDGQTIAYSAEVNGVLQIFTRNVSAPAPAQVTDAAFDCKHPFWSRDGKRLYYISMAKTRDSIWSVGAAGGTPQVVVHNASRGAISPDGRTLAFLRDEERADIIGTAILYLATPKVAEPWSSDLVEAAATRYAEFGALRFVEGALAFSPDGRSLGLVAVPFRAASLRAGGEAQYGWGFWLVPLAGGRPPSRRLASWIEPVPRVTGFTWLPDSRHVVLSVTVAAMPGPHLWMADIEGDRVWPLTRSADNESYPSSAPAGERVVFTTGESDYDLVELSTSGNTSKTVLATARKETDPAWSPDGTVVAYVTDRNGTDEIWLRNRAGVPFDRPLITQRDFADAQVNLLATPAFAPNGQSIAYLRNARPTTVPVETYALRIFTTRTAGGPPVPLLPTSRYSYQVAPTWSPDGQWIAFAGWRERNWDLVKVRVGSSEEPIVLRTDGVPNATPHWSPNGDWITWETEAGFVLVSADGTSQRAIDTDQWLVHAWSRDSSTILGVIETEDLRLSVISVEIGTGRARDLADLGPSPPVNNPVQGFSVSPDGKTILTSLVRMRGDLWLLEGLRAPTSRWRQFFSTRP